MLAEELKLLETSIVGVSLIDTLGILATPTLDGRSLRVLELFLILKLEAVAIKSFICVEVVKQLVVEILKILFESMKLILVLNVYKITGDASSVGSTLVTVFPLASLGGSLFAVVKRLMLTVASTYEQVDYKALSAYFDYK